ncbi:hypothetical protein MOTT27_01023 [Mycobacterium intracellulare subsp. yongonense]|nr:hypothetical protein MOTT27_01023 [Mycobacterium intracellulare subsp. yongonense]
MQEILVLAAQRVRHVLHGQRYGRTADQGEGIKVAAAVTSVEHQTHAHGDDKENVPNCPDHDCSR